ncbi:ankyrin repeat domain-containing protein [Streptomyces sp. A0592]|uniref:ankyrin repeat domain-containing protein n=1 Tax=Streptomyces sp. A0592 TaxID=2563099 RepID=UPI00109EDFC5|nr:ankyrin repeat domain-containing protein [Streptomyces sp. A0592]THA81654.1 ankyrin repeat domain-containing protein [Streptomyces sp. A0592]
MSDYWPPAHQAVELEEAEALARLPAAGADPDEVFGGMTLLTHAIDTEGDGALQSGGPLTVRTTAVLPAFGADPELVGPNRRTPMEQAGLYGHRLAQELLIAHIGRRASVGR